MTLSPGDKAKMEKADTLKTQIQNDPILYRVYKEGLISAHKDNAETIAKLEAERDKWRKKYETLAINQYNRNRDLIEECDSLEAERDETLEAIDLMIVDRDDAYTKREHFRKLWSEAECDKDNLKVRVEELEEERDRYQTALIAIQDETNPAWVNDEVRNALTPQGADTPCEECGTVGGGGKVPGGEKPYPIMNTRENKPCPRCGA